jgi:hypothetical protein
MALNTPSFQKISPNNPSSGKNSSLSGTLAQKRKLNQIMPMDPAPLFQTNLPSDRDLPTTDRPLLANPNQVFLPIDKYQSTISEVNSQGDQMPIPQVWPQVLTPTISRASGNNPSGSFGQEQNSHMLSSKGPKGTMDSLPETLENFGKKDAGAFLKFRQQNSFDKETVNFAQKKNFLTMRTFQSNWSQSNMEGESDFVGRSPFEGGSSAKNESSGRENY